MMRALPGIMVVVIGLLYWPAYFVLYMVSERMVTATITEKVVKRTGNEDRYLILTDHGAFEVVDSLFYLDWRATDRYASAPVNETCDLRVAGWRWGWRSWYPNVIEVGNCRSH